MKVFSTIWVVALCCTVIFFFFKSYQNTITYTGELCVKEIGYEVEEECTWFIVTQDKIVIQEAEVQWEEKVLEYETKFACIRLVTESGYWLIHTNGNKIEKVLNRPSIGADLVWSNSSSIKQI